MTPEEIDNKLKELGLTREEAIQKAAEYNISLEDYLNKASKTTAPAQGAQQQENAPPEIGNAPQARGALLPAAKKPEIPGFAGRIGTENLFPFGYDIFNASASTFNATLNAPAPESYPLGPGDEIVITVWGETKLNYQLTVNREGNVLISDVGPVSAFGCTIQQFRERLLHRMSRIYSGLRDGGPDANTFMDVSVGRLRTVQVFVLGEVQRPGGYVLSAMATTLQALYMAGGPTSNGSMRKVQINRTGKPSISFDLYDYIIHGSKSSDTRLQNGDVVFVPPAGKRAAITGNVVRPAIYELNDGETLSDFISLAGGLRFNAYFNRIHIERVIPFDQRKANKKDLLDVDLKFETIGALEESQAPMDDGDIVTVLKVSELPENRVTVIGNVRKPGMFELTPGMRIRDLLLAADSLDRNTFAERGSILRLLPNLRREMLSFSPALALGGEEKNNLLLKNEDTVIIYKESQFFPEHYVTIGGAVRNPGRYPRHQNMAVTDLVMLAGGIREDATTKGWEISRTDSSELTTYSKVYKTDVPVDYWNVQEDKRFLLQDFDLVFVPADPNYSKQKIVQIAGYVMYPGVYSIQHEGERLADFIKRAGGLRPGSYLEGSRYVRKSIDAGWSPSEETQVVAASASFVDSLKARTKQTEAASASAGWIPINFRRALDDPSSRDNIAVEEGDSVYVAYLEDLVYVKGEVFVPSPVVYKKGESVNYYINQAGGFKEEADEGKVVVFLPGGTKLQSRMWPFPDPDVLPGSVVYVPKKIEKPDNTLQILSSWATVMASLAAISIAIVQVTK